MPDALRAYRAASWALVPLARPVLLRRRAQGKEHPQRWSEKLGQASAPRPDGPLIWLHAVGLGEVMALRALFPFLTEVSVLVTSTSRASGDAIAPYLPAGAVHQYVPLDLPPYAKQFLDHWRPDAVAWAEQELWPGLVSMAAARGIPQAIVNGRMRADAFTRKQKLPGLSRAVFGRMEWISAQTDDMAERFVGLGGRAVRVDGSLKPAAPPLQDDPAVADDLGGRNWWIGISTNETDDKLCLAAQKARVRDGQASGLILAPRDLARLPDLKAVVSDLGLENHVHIVDRLGALGGYLHRASAAFIGGTTGDGAGKNPWEAARLGLAIVRGPQISNFKDDFAALGEAATVVETAEDLAEFLDTAPLKSLGSAAQKRALDQVDRVRPVAEALVRMAMR